jgi:hypothetical protein
MRSADSHEHGRIATQIRAMKAFGTVEISGALEFTRAQELDRRLAAYRRNPAAGSPWPDVRDRLLTRPLMHK